VCAVVNVALILSEAERVASITDEGEERESSAEEAD
jgi:hypothetical protein